MPKSHRISAIAKWNVAQNIRGPGRYRFLVSAMAVSLISSACGGDENPAPSEPPVSMSISGTLNETPIEITSGFCKILPLPEGNLQLTIGRNLAFPSGMLLIVPSLEVLHEGTYILLHPDLQAYYDATTPANSGTVVISNMATTAGHLTALGGSATLFFTGQTAGELRITFSCEFS